MDEGPGSEDADINDDGTSAIAPGFHPGDEAAFLPGFVATNG